jgi:mannose-6-phosphate isomerase-like protein (cupin superfamily)
VTLTSFPLEDAGRSYSNRRDAFHRAGRYRDAVADETPQAPALAGGHAGAAGGAFVLVEWGDPGGVTSAERPIAGLHVHHQDDEVWYVLDGVLGFRIGERRLTAAAGSAVVAPCGTPHSYWNAGPGPARYLIVMPPRLLRLVEALHGGGSIDVARIFREHASELLT